MRAVSVWIIPGLGAEVVWHEAWNVRRPVKAHQVRHAGADRCDLEPFCVRDDPARHKPAVAPTHHAEPFAVRHAHLDHLINPAHQVPVVASAPVFEIREPELRAVAGRAARVHPQHRVTSRGERRDRISAAIANKTLREDARWAPVNYQQHRHSLAGLVVRRIGQQAFHIQAVGALPLDDFGTAQRQPG